MFLNRQEAGEKLALKLKKYQNNSQAIILALPRGGVVVGYELAKRLNLPLDIIITRKVGAPGNPEFALGAVTQEGQLILNKETLNYYNLDSDYLKKEAERQIQEIKRRLKKYRGARLLVNLKDKIVIIVDDGIATGASIKAAIYSIKNQKPKKIILAIPVGPKETIEELRKEVDKIVCLKEPEIFFAVGQFYQSFEQVPDEEVKKLLSLSDNKNS